MVEQGPTYGVPRVRVTVKSLDAITPDADVPEWVIAGASVAEFTNEIRVSPPLITAPDAFMISLKPKRTAQPQVDYSVVVRIGENVVEPKTVRWKKGEIQQGRAKEVEWREVDLRAGVRIVVNVLRGLSVD